jgi:hypothetical protein
MEFVLGVHHLRAADKGASDTQILNFALYKTVSSHLHDRQFDLNPGVISSFFVIDHILILVCGNKGLDGGVSKGYARTLDIKIKLDFIDLSLKHKNQPKRKWAINSTNRKMTSVESRAVGVRFQVSGVRNKKHRS